MAQLAWSGSRVTFTSGRRRITVEVPREALNAKEVDGLVVVLFNWEGVRPLPTDCLDNVHAFDSQGNLVWKIQPFQWHQGSVYMSISVRDGKLWAYATPGFDVEVDPKTGRILSSHFVK